ncbi:TonB-dependent siderophore receptor [Halomonas sp. BLK-85]
MQPVHQYSSVLTRISNPESMNPLLLSIRRACAGAASGFLLLGPSSVLAQDDTVDLGAVTVQAEALSLVTEGSDDYRVAQTSTPTRLDLTPRETPQSTSTLTRAQLDDFQLNTVNEALESVPGVTIERLETDRTYYTARGFDINNFQVDGLRVPMPYNNIHGDMDTAVYDRIEVVRGATGLMSGSGNPAATVNFVRKRPTSSPQASVGVSAGSWNRQRVDADVSGPLDDAGRVRGRLVAAGLQTDSYLDRLSRERGLLYGVLEADITDTTRLSVGHTWQDNNTDSNMWGSLPSYDTAGNPTNYSRSTSSAPDWSYWDGETHRSFIELSQELNNDWSLKTTLTHLDMLSDTQLFYIYGSPDAASGQIDSSQLTLSQYERHLEQWVADVHAKGTIDAFGRSHQLVVGSDWSQSRNQQESRYPVTSPTTPLPPLDEWNGAYPEPTEWIAYPTTVGDATIKERSFYTAAKLDLADRWTGVAGTRVSWFDAYGEQYGVSQATDADAVVTPYVGVIYDITPDASLYASYTSIFSPQTETDISGEYLDPIDGEAQEVGIKADVFDMGADATLSAFRITQDNVAQPNGTLPDGTAIYAEGDGITSKGFEATLAGELAPGWQANLGYTYIDIEDADGQAANTYIPRHMVRASTSYRPASLDQLKIGARVRWQDEIERERDLADGKTRQEAYTLVDLMASYDFSERLTGSLNINNVTDEKYLTSLKWDQSFYGASRHFMANVTWRY